MSDVESFAFGIIQRTSIIRMLPFQAHHDADVRAQKDGWTALDLALRNGHVEVARFLVEHSADVTTQEKDWPDQWTPWHSASFHRHVEVVRVLVEHGADVTAKLVDELTP